MANKQVVEFTVTIAQDATESAEVDLGGRTVWSIQFPAEMTGTGLTVKNGVSAAVVRNFANDGDYTVTKANSKQVPVDVRVSGSWNKIKLVSSASEAAARTFKLLAREND